MEPDQPFLNWSIPSSHEHLSDFSTHQSVQRSSRWARLTYVAILLRVGFFSSHTELIPTQPRDLNLMLQVQQMFSATVPLEILWDGATCEANAIALCCFRVPLRQFFSFHEFNVQSRNRTSEWIEELFAIQSNCLGLITVKVTCVPVKASILYSKKKADTLISNILLHLRIEYLRMYTW
jgi:hypothetical protein